MTLVIGSLYWPKSKKFTKKNTPNIWSDYSPMPTIWKDMHIVAMPMMFLNQLPFTFTMSTDLLIQNAFLPFRNLWTWVSSPNTLSHRVDSGPLVASWRFSPPLRFRGWTNPSGFRIWDPQKTQFHWKILGGTMTYKRCHPIMIAWLELATHKYQQPCKRHLKAKQWRLPPI